MSFTYPAIGNILRARSLISKLAASALAGLPGTEILTRNFRKGEALFSSRRRCGFPKTLGRAKAVALGFGFTVLWPGRGFERVDKFAGSSRNSLDRHVERGLVRLRGPRESSELTHELKRRSPDLIIGRGRVEIEKRFYVSAH